MIARRSYLLLAALGACGGSGGADACELGPELWQQTLNALVASEPACASDDDCVKLDTDIACRNVSIELCGAVMHKSAAARWDAGALCKEIDDQSAPSKISCTNEASCVSLRPACVNNVCTGVE